MRRAGAGACAAKTSNFWRIHVWTAPEPMDSRLQACTVVDLTMHDDISVTMMHVGFTIINISKNACLQNATPPILRSTTGRPAVGLTLDQS
eukprot:1148048-Pelagomonas_calceolata.AAC.6